ncbi:MAG TPA: hypothetical protein VJ552_03735 [Sediminibacterium sp.]|nr:hypothetical protein [Sediminibacterium sp.]
MFLFPILYIAFFLVSLKYLAQDKVKGILLFIVFGLPIYTMALSVSYMYGLSKLIPVLQSFKELSLLLYLGYAILNIREKIQLQWMDRIMLAFFCYVFIYVLMPLGSYTFLQRLLAFKSLSFFPLIYFTGRLVDVRKIQLNEIFHYICLLTVTAAAVLLFEVITYTHIQTYSGYAPYALKYFDQETTGSYGLSWTFEIENGMKRFASIFSTPLELSAATLIATAALAALVTDHRNKMHLTRFTQLALISTLFTISFALSRASFASYFVMIYVYAAITGHKRIIQLIHIGILTAAAILLLVSIQSDFVDFIINTINFSNASSAGHVLEWLNGLDSMMLHPLGIGLGESGRLSAMTGYNTGGENQFVIIGVQAGVIALGLYIAAYINSIRTALSVIRKQTGKIRRLGIFILLIKIGLFIPLFTAEVESYIYVSYITWFLTGFLFNMVSHLPKKGLLCQP